MTGLGILGGPPSSQRKRKRKRKQSAPQGQRVHDLSEVDDGSSEDGYDDGDIQMGDYDSRTEPEIMNNLRSTSETPDNQQDPESLAKAHRLFLHFLLRGLFLSDHTFTVVS